MKTDGATESAEQRDWNLYFQDGRSDASRNVLIERYREIVRHHAFKYAKVLPNAISVEELESMGIDGLIDAIAHFNPDRGVKFTTYCVLRIYGAMRDGLRQLDWVPRLIRSRATKFHAATRAIEERTGEPATDEALAAMLGCSIEEIVERRLEAQVLYVDSLSNKLAETESGEEVFASQFVPGDSDYSSWRGSQDLDLLRLITKGLNKTERVLIISYYYLDQTMNAIGKTLGLSESRVSQLHTAILARMSKRLTYRLDEFHPHFLRNTDISSNQHTRNNDMSTTFRTGQIAKICDVAPRTVSKWIDTGRLQGYRIPGSTDRRVGKAELIRFIADNKMPQEMMDAVTRESV